MLLSPSHELGFGVQLTLAAPFGFHDMTETTLQSGVQGGRLFFESALLEDDSRSGFGVHLAAGGLAATSDIPGGNALWELTAAMGWAWRSSKAASFLGLFVRRMGNTEKRPSSGFSEGTRSASLVGLMGHGFW